MFSKKFLSFFIVIICTQICFLNKIFKWYTERHKVYKSVTRKRETAYSKRLDNWLKVCEFVG